MNRAERRRVKKETPKAKQQQHLLSWLRTLSKDKIELINRYAQDKSNEAYDRLIQALDRSFSASMIHNTDYTMEEINNIFVQAMLLIEEDTEKVKKLQEKHGGNWEMAVKKQQEEVLEKIKMYLESGISKKEAIENLVMDFPKLSKSMLTNAYQREKEAAIKKAEEKNIKEVTGKTVGDEVVKEAYDYIFGEDKKVEAKEIEGAENIKKEEKAMQAKGVVANNATTESKLEILEETVVKIKTIKVRGQNGEYKGETGKGLILSREENSIYFRNEEQLDSWVAEFREVFARLKS